MSDLRISRVTIRNFRCVQDIQVDLEPGTTYLVGENNVGKTSILLALWSALGRRRPLDDDLRQTVDTPAPAEASVDVLLCPRMVNSSPPKSGSTCCTCSAFPPRGRKRSVFARRSNPAARAACCQPDGRFFSPTVTANGHASTPHAFVPS